MAASVVLTNLPRDASKALENAGNPSIQKSTYKNPPLHLTTIPHSLGVFIFHIAHHPHIQLLTPRTVTVRLQPIGSAPQLTQRVFKVSTKQSFASIVRFLRKKLGVRDHESVFCYVGSVFAPALDESVVNLWTVSGLKVEGSVCEMC